jgi:hypothetical protein
MMHLHLLSCCWRLSLKNHLAHTYYGLKSFQYQQFGGKQAFLTEKPSQCMAVWLILQKRKGKSKICSARLNSSRIAAKELLQQRDDGDNSNVDIIIEI